MTSMAPTCPVQSQAAQSSVPVSNGDKHHAEDTSRLCSSPQTTSSDVIHDFMNNGRKLLDHPIPRQRQILRDFLNEAVIPHLPNSPRCFGADIVDSSTGADIALLDDRQKHLDCAKSIRKTCAACHVFSNNLNIPQWYQRLREERRAHKAERRIMSVL
ncbi:hypothetical protein P153DRAFT_193815 [Dothidotthia symphoricarpi CBS 119687]|uniref:Uncharacterized protein n=1 Tax=Dothidotthia symphoricarpi CBS 119687 TaxID=1392245 RepID=A0A6A6AKD3_9PLEO|nr:uncharacterized protein P153DRAFT_193815 [Dothidotthia symphoricarpi CBS 119687]KAF2131374.1 hypothetical protein P153DRAFT_193815 [Dothidotthia symphoricarpi CBS 119687]